MHKIHHDEQSEFNNAVNDILKTKKLTTTLTTTATTSTSSNSSDDVGMDTDGDAQPPTTATTTTTQTEEPQLTIDELPLLTSLELDTHLNHLNTTVENLSGEINILEEERDKMKGNLM